MTELSTKLDQSIQAVQKYRHLLLPIAAAGLIFVILVPLPPGLMNVLVVGNIALSAIILLTTLAVGRPLEFSSFPSVLLGATLLRLVLNVAITRLILTAGADGQSVEQARYAAGSVVWAFSNFVTGGSLAVGLILFTIIVVIQFLVVTKGAGRISEVTARFVLDAMPGKQMAIDADLSAKAITPAQAQARRAEVGREADFYGAMDGASKFLRGDAIAAVIITLVNLFGGIYVGLVQYGWDWSRTVELFSRLTIGDGLVTQIPAFIVALSSALIVTRSAAQSNLGEQVTAQLVSRPAVLLTTAAFLALLALASLPAAPLVLIGGACVALALVVARQKQRPPAQDGPAAEPADAEATAPAPASAPAQAATTGVEDLLRVDPIRVEVGLSLVNLVQSDADPAGNELLAQIDQVRREIAAELGLLVPAVRVKDNLQLGAHQYAILIRGARIAQGRAYAGQLLAITDEMPESSFDGRWVEEPILGRPAIWIRPQQADRAGARGCKVLTPVQLLADHLRAVLRRHAWELLSRQQVATMVADLRARCPSLVDEVAARFRMGVIHKVLQGLLREAVGVHDLETILEAMSDWPGESEDIALVGEHVRGSLARTLSQKLCSSDGKLWCVALSATWEDELAAHVERQAQGDLDAADRDLSHRLTESLREGLAQLRRQGRKPVVLCSPAVRKAAWRLIAPAETEAAVLAYNEIDSVEVKTLSSIGIEP